MDEKLANELATQTQHFKSLIADYCRLESVAAQNRMMRETADWVETLLKETGFATRQLPVAGAPNYVYGEIKGKSDFTLLLYNHYDVQPEAPLDLWESPPFEVTEKEGHLVARGICDNKAELIARICAIRAMQAAQGELPINIKWIIEGEEEIGSTHFDEMTRQYGDLLKTDGALWEGGGFNEKGQAHIALGFRGLLYVEYHVETMTRDAHSGGAHTLPSAAWRLVKALASLKDDDGKVLIPGFYDDVRAPTAMEQQAARDNVDLEQEARAKAMYGIDAFLHDRSGYDLEISVFEPTANIAGVLTGYTEPGVKTVLPGKAMAKMDFRLVPEQRPDDVLAKLQAHFKAQGFDDVHVTKLGSGDPVVTPLEGPFVQKVTQICQAFTGQEPKIIPLGGGTLPLLGAMKNNVGVLGISTAGNPAYYGSGAHAPNEHIRVSDIPRAIEFNAFLFTQLGETG
ncbi:MAG TPA: M20/M25/M40 family metallo-hydrolase [Caldilineaceae bacterium]|nr:M20/M25/M40 family metallo-hydrolase [Caldilineaceae bacterium]